LTIGSHAHPYTVIALRQSIAIEMTASNGYRLAKTNGYLTYDWVAYVEDFVITHRFISSTCGVWVVDFGVGIVYCDSDPEDGIHAYLHVFVPPVESFFGLAAADRRICCV